MLRAFLFHFLLLLLLRFVSFVLDRAVVLLEGLTTEILVLMRRESQIGSGTLEAADTSADAGVAAAAAAAAHSDVV